MSLLTALIVGGGGSLLGLFSGPFAAVYCGAMLGIRRDLQSTVFAAIAAFVGFFHLLWVLVLTELTISLWPSLGQVGSIILMLTDTSLVYSIIIGVGTRSFWAGGVVLLFGTSACLFEHVGSTFLPISDLRFAAEIVLLHLGNLAATVCPECGTNCTPKMVRQPTRKS